MTVKHHEFLVEYLDEPTGLPREVEVRVIMADRLNVEMRGRKYGLTEPKEQPQLLGFLWLYFAMIRTGEIPETTTFEEFKERALDNQAVGDVEVPPTPGESDDLLSASPSGSPSSTGSTSSDLATTN